jgi:hypothetical protein
MMATHLSMDNASFQPKLHHKTTISIASKPKDLTALLVLQDTTSPPSMEFALN